MRRITLIFPLLLICLSAIAEVPLKIPGDLTINQSHPRLFIDNDEFAQMKKQISWGYNEALVKMHNGYLEMAIQSVDKNDHFEFKKSSSGKRMLATSRKALRELGACSYAYRYTKNKKYLERASMILDDVCSFETWNPSHYLDVAEMAVGVALAYDWLYDKLAPQVREKCEQMIKSQLFETSEVPRYKKRFLAHNNWGQVLNCALACAAVAFYDTNPDLCQRYIRRAVTDNAMTVESNYAPDGIYPEGSTYWSYGTGFQILLNSAVWGVYGSDFGLSEAQGFQKSAEFVVFSMGNIRKAFNYSDSREKRFSVPGLWYFAYRFNEPDLVYNELKSVASKSNYNYTDRIGFIHIYYASKCPIDNLQPFYKNVFYGHGPNPMVMARTGWKKGDCYLAAKGGGTQNNHSHMDAGSFVYEDAGVRWVSDPPYPSYEKSEVVLAGLNSSLWKMDQTSMRWKQFGYNNAQHSTLTINGKDHCCSGSALLEQVYDSPERKGGRFDLSSTFAGDVKSAYRTICIVDDSFLEVEDEIVALDSLDAHVRWNVTTEANVKVTDDGIVLSSGDKQMFLKAEGYKVVYTDQMYKPQNVPQELDVFYNSELSYAAFTFVVPAGQKVIVRTTLKRMR